LSRIHTHNQHHETAAKLAANKCTAHNLLDHLDQIVCRNKLGIAEQVVEELDLLVQIMSNNVEEAFNVLDTANRRQCKECFDLKKNLEFRNAKKLYWKLKK
jgi:Na+/phosphate symporter